MFIVQCIIVTVEEWKTNLMSLVILFHFLCAQHVSDINISTVRSLRLCCWITTSVVLFSVRCVLEFGAAGFGWCSFCRLKHNVLQPAKRMQWRCCLQAASSLRYTTSCKHRVVLLRMDEIMAGNMLSWLKLLIKLLLLHVVGCLYYCINDVRSHKHQKRKINRLFLLISQYSQAK